MSIHSHGFYRFLAWEILLGMFALNVEIWFQNLFAWYQLISWILLIVSIVLVILGLRLLRQIGEQDAGRKDASLIGWNWNPALAPRFNFAKGLPLKNYYAVGHYTFNPGGVPTAMITAWYIAREILKRTQKEY